MSSPPARLKAFLISIPVLLLLGMHSYLYRWICDDAFISFRYAWNLVHGNGLVFNVGERVEGYTNFLWTLEIAAAMLAGIDPEFAAHLLSIVFTVGTLFCVFLLSFRSAEAIPFPYFTDHLRVLAAPLSLLLLALNRHFAMWTTGGLETREFTFFLILALLCIEKTPRSLFLAGLSLAAAAYTRPEGIMFAGLAVAVYALELLLKRQWSWRKLAALATPPLVLITAHFAFRYFYYGELFPNTFYAKHVRPWPEAGSRYLGAAGVENAFYLSLPLAAYYGWRVRRTSAVPIIAFAWLCFHAIYLLRIGGDHFEFRPFDFWLPVASVYCVLGALWGTARLASLPRFTGRRTPVVLFALVIVMLLHYSTVIQWSKRLDILRMIDSGQKMDLYSDLTPENAKVAWLTPGLQFLIWPYNHAMRYCVSHVVASAQEEHKLFLEARREQYGPYGTNKVQLPVGSVVADAYVGFKPFQFPSIPFVDLHGLNDHYIARQPVNVPNRERFMAHDKWGEGRYVSSRGVNMNILPVVSSLEEAMGLARYAAEIRPGLFMPFDATSTETLLANWNRYPVHTQSAQVERVIADWSQGIPEGWIAEGEAMKGQPRTGFVEDQPWFFGAGVPMINSFHPSLKGKAVGELRSPEFKVISGTSLEFSLAGSPHEPAAVQLWVNGRIRKEWSARDFFRMTVERFQFSKSDITFQIIIRDRWEQERVGWTAVGNINLVRNISHVRAR